MRINVFIRIHFSYILINTDGITWIQRPHPGIRNIFVSSSTEYSLRVTATSNVSFIYGFSINYTTNISNISSQPFRGKNNYE